MMKTLFTALLAALGGLAHATPSAQISELHDLVSNWQLVRARDALEPLVADDPEDLHVRFTHARVLYFEGRYAESVEVLDQIIEQYGVEEAPRAVKGLRGQVAATRDALKDFDEFVTEDRRFLIRFKGADRLLLPYLLDVLKRTDAALAQDFAWRPKGQVVVEIYPEIKYLAAVSPLTEEEIETSGTIALCKYNRLMFTSPRALVRGYGWRDTVAHEFVHYYVTKMSENTVPIWLHEGIAKFQEARWRTAPGLGLDPPQEDLLARSLKSGKLITFDQMHPSMAKLPSQEAASLAFAEVHTVIAYLHEKKGYAGINALLGRLRAGDTMDRALVSSFGVNLSSLWRTWRSDMKRRGFRTFPGLVQTSLKFRRPGEAEAEEEADYATIGEKKVKDFTHLGELLRARERDGAALAEYRKAMILGGEGNPVIQNGAAASMVALGKYAEIPGTLERVRQYYPGFVTTHIHLGEAYAELGQADAAIAAFDEAVGINPFDPRPHQALYELYKAAGRTEDADRARKSLEILQ